jgi:methyl-accepting chemotaxis protein
VYCRGHIAGNTEDAFIEAWPCPQTGHRRAGQAKLLQVRIAGFNAKALRVEVAVGVAVLVVAWLMVGSYRSAKRPLQRTLVTLEALAQGDLTRTVPVDTRDEVGAAATSEQTAKQLAQTAVQLREVDARFHVGNL